MKTTDVQVAPAEPVGNMVPRRRKLLLGASSAVTVVASLKSGSALAEGLCASPSAFSSIKVTAVASHKPSGLPACHSHGYWKKSDQAWPVSKATTVAGAAFSPTSYSGIFAPSTTLLTIVGMGGGGMIPFARDLVCAYLDVMSGNAAPYVLETDVKAMWALVFGGIAYAPNGIPWTATNVRDWLDVMVGSAAL